MPEQYVKCIEEILRQDMMTKPKGIEDTILQRLGLQNDNLPADLPAVKTLRNKVSSMNSKLKKDGVMTPSTHIVTPKNSNRLKPNGYSTT